MSTLNDIEISEKLMAIDKARFDYFLPHYLLKRFLPKSKICSVGCGMAYDVERLNELGYDAYGFDPGSRTKVWRQHRKEWVLKKLKVAEVGNPSLQDFVDSFDYAYALEVIEHVATENGSWKLLPNYFEERVKFMEGCMDLLKVGGKLIITTSNRLCPIDIAHGHHYNRFTDFMAKNFGLPLTIPFSSRNFVCSFKDIATYLNCTQYQGRYAIKSLSTYGYASNSKHKANKFIAAFFNTYMKVANIPALRTSFLNPLLSVEITKLP